MTSVLWAFICLFFSSW